MYRIGCQLLRIADTDIYRDILVSVPFLILDNEERGACALTRAGIVRATTVPSKAQAML